MTKTKKYGPRMSLTMAQRAVSRDRYDGLAAQVCVLYIHVFVCALARARVCVRACAHAACVSCWM